MWPSFPLKKLLILAAVFILVLCLNGARMAAGVYITATPTARPVPTLNLTPFGGSFVVGTTLPKPPLSARAITAANIRRMTEVARFANSVPGLNHARFDPGDTQLISNSEDGLIVWSVPQFGKLRSLPMRPTGSEWPFAVHPNGQLVAAANIVEDGWIELWDMGTAQRLRQYQGGGSVVDLTFNQAGTLLVARRGDDEIHVWNVASGNLQLELRPPKACQLTFNPVPATIVVLDEDKKLDAYDMQTGSLVSSTRIDLFPQSSVCTDISMSYSPDGQSLALWLFQDKHIFVWRDGRVTATLTRDIERSIWDIFWSPDSTLLVTMESDERKSGDQIVFWDVAKQQEVRMLDDPNDFRQTLAFSSDGAWLVIGRGWQRYPEYVEELIAFAIQP